MNELFFAGFEKLAAEDTRAFSIGGGALTGALLADVTGRKPHLVPGRAHPHAEYFRLAGKKVPPVVPSVVYKSPRKTKLIGAALGAGAAGLVHHLTKAKKHEKRASDGGTHVSFIRTRGLSDDEFGSLKDSIKHVGEERKKGAGGDWREGAMKHFYDKHPHLKGKVTAGGHSRLATGHSGHVVAAHRFGDKNEVHAHGHYTGGLPSERFMRHFTGVHEKVAGSLGSGRVDRFLKALKKKPSLLPTVHGKVRARDLTDQLRGTVSHVETSLEDAVDRAKKTQAKGGFRGTSV